VAKWGFLEFSGGPGGNFNHQTPNIKGSGRFFPKASGKRVPID
jgi:hypothetical protein